MKSPLATCTLLASLALASASTLLTLEELKAEGFEIYDLEFHGAITPGGPEVHLSGTAETIYKQVLELNPEYDPWQFPEHVEYMKSLGITKDTPKAEAGVVVMGHGVEARQGNFDCGWGSRVSNFPNQCLEGLRYLSALGTRWCGAARGACARVSCSTNCGMFLCNTHNNHIDVHCGDIQMDVTAISDNCGQDLAGRVWMAHGRRIFGSHFVGLSEVSC